jgi:Protein of unknown function (DUF1501)
VDKMCFIRSMVADGLDHGGALLQMHTGTVVLTRPSYGSWLLYGLGTENQDLPGFITINPHRGHSGVRNWSTAFLPGAFQGTPIDVGGGAAGRRRATGEAPAPEKEPIENLTNKLLSSEQQRFELEYLRDVSLRQSEANKYDERLEARLHPSNWLSACRPMARTFSIFKRNRPPRSSCTGWTIRSLATTACSC